MAEDSVSVSSVTSGDIKMSEIRDGLGYTSDNGWTTTDQGFSKYYRGTHIEGDSIDYSIAKRTPNQERVTTGKGTQNTNPFVHYGTSTDQYGGPSQCYVIDARDGGSFWFVYRLNQPSGLEITDSASWNQSEVTQLAAPTGLPFNSNPTFDYNTGSHTNETRVYHNYSNIYGRFPSTTGTYIDSTSTGFDTLKTILNLTGYGYSESDSQIYYAQGYQAPYEYASSNINQDVPTSGEIRASDFRSLVYVPTDKT